MWRRISNTMALIRQMFAMCHHCFTPFSKSLKHGYIFFYVSCNIMFLHLEECLSYIENICGQQRSDCFSGALCWLLGGGLNMLQWWIALERLLIRPKIALPEIWFAQTTLHWAQPIRWPQERRKTSRGNGTIRSRCRDALCCCLSRPCYPVPPF